MMFHVDGISLSYHEGLFSTIFSWYLALLEMPQDLNSNTCSKATIKDVIDKGTNIPRYYNSAFIIDFEQVFAQNGQRLDMFQVESFFSSQSMSQSFIFHSCFF